MRRRRIKRVDHRSVWLTRVRKIASSRTVVKPKSPSIFEYQHACVFYRVVYVTSCLRRSSSSHSCPVLLLLVSPYFFRHAPVCPCPAFSSFKASTLHIHRSNLDGFEPLQSIPYSSLNFHNTAIVSRLLSRSCGHTTLHNTTLQASTSHPRRLKIAAFVRKLRPQLWHCIKGPNLVFQPTRMICY